jgi:hypothetical protein
MTMSDNTSKDDIELQQERPNDQDKKTHYGMAIFTNKETTKNKM